MAHPNEELLRRGYEAFAAGDMDTVLSIFHPDIVGMSVVPTRPRVTTAAIRR